ncbi:MAG: DUF2062 domain-containing protein [Pseudomonadota bacterium]
MLFKRRSGPTIVERTRVMLWPRRSFGRSTQYYVKRVKRVNATPYAIAMGVACGAFSSFTPLIGFHFLLAFALAYILRANLLAAAIGTAVGNPLTFPLIWAVTFRVGRTILGEPVRPDAEPVIDAPSAYTVEALSGFFESTWPLMKPMLVGAVPLGLTAAVACYFVVYGTVYGYQSARQAKFARDVEDGTAPATAQSSVAGE